MAQHDMVIDNQYAAQLRGDMNAALVALVGLSEGYSQPTITFANMFWADLTAGLLRKRNSANTGWNIIGPLNSDYGFSFPAGTRMPFNQTAAPTGWTKDTTAALNDSAMRIVTGAVGSGGTVGFGTAFASHTPTISTGLGSLIVHDTTLTTAQIPQVNLQIYRNTTGYSSISYVAGSTLNVPLPEGGFNGGVTWVDADTTAVQGRVRTTPCGGGAHAHSISGAPTATSSAINLAVKYNDFIIATKN